MGGEACLNEFFYFNGRELSVSSLLNELHSRLEVGHEDVVFLSGSMVEGLENSASDLDIYIVRAAETFQPYWRRGATAFEWEGVTCDVEEVSQAEVDDLSRRLAEVVKLSDREQHVYRLVEREWDLLYRVSRGQFIHNQLQFNFGMKENLKLYKLAYCVNHLHRNQNNILGFLSRRDIESAKLVAMETIYSSFDCILAMNEDLSLPTKWRLQRLRALGADWSNILLRDEACSAETKFLSFLEDARLAGDENSRRWIRAIVTFSRSVCAATYLFFLGLQSTTRRVRPIDPDQTGAPSLSLHCMLRLIHNKFILVNIRQMKESIELPAEVIPLVVSIDGRTSKSDLERWASGLSGSRAEEFVDNLLYLLDSQGLITGRISNPYRN